MKLKYQFAVEELAGNYAAVAVEAGAAEFNGMLRMNEVGKVIFEALREETTREEIVGELKKQFLGDEKDMHREVDAFTAKLAEAGLLV